VCRPTSITPDRVKTQSGGYLLSVIGCSVLDGDRAKGNVLQRSRKLEDDPNIPHKTVAGAFIIAGGIGDTLRLLGP